jgi:hypothetical protein
MESSKAWQITNRQLGEHPELMASVQKELTQSYMKKLGFGASLDWVLKMGAPWAPPDIVKAHMTENCKPGDKYALFFIQCIPTLEGRWCVIPAKDSMKERVHLLLITITKEEYSTLCSFEVETFGAQQARLKGIWALWHAEAEKINRFLQKGE